MTGKISTFSYSTLDLLLQVCDNNEELANYEYHPDGMIKSLIHGPIRQEYAYDADKNLTALKVLSTDAILMNNSYQYDGNRTLKRQAGGDTLYHYDPLNQLHKKDYYNHTTFYSGNGHMRH